MKNPKAVMTMILMACFMMTASISAKSQAKPKGKPWPAPATAIKMANPVKADAASLKHAKEIYEKNCKSCHGATGKGDGTKAAKIDISCGDFSSAEYTKISDGELFWKTTEGRKPMPSFKEILDESEIWSVINYTKSLAGGK